MSISPHLSHLPWIRHSRCSTPRNLTPFNRRWSPTAWSQARDRSAGCRRGSHWHPLHLWPCSWYTKSPRTPFSSSYSGFRSHRGNHITQNWRWSLASGKSCSVTYPTYLIYAARYRAPAERMMDPSKLFATSSTKTDQTPYDRLQAPFLRKQMASMIVMQPDVNRFSHGSHMVLLGA